jgi:hypothetical protein
MKTVWLLWRLWVTRGGQERKSLVCVCGSYNTALLKSTGIEEYDIEEVQVQE